MQLLMGLVVLASSLWMASDAARLGYDTRDVRGVAAMSPGAWFICGLLLWIVAFPLYLIKRPELAAAGERRRLGMTGAPGFLPPPYPPQGYPPAPPQAYPPSAYPPPAYPPPAYPPPAYPPAPAPAKMTLDEVTAAIVKLGELHQAGLLTEAEFEQQKAQVLARMG